MMNHEITSIVGHDKRRKRVGKGIGSGHGKTSGRGVKGAGSRSGCKARLGNEGGQVPLYRRLPKRGFNNFNFTTRYEVINVSQLDGFEDGTVVDVKRLFCAGLIRSADSMVQLLGDGELTKKLDVNVHKFSKTAHDKILSCGGVAKVVA